nr:hypothetical protein P5627_04140 [Bacillus safensis]
MVNPATHFQQLRQHIRDELAVVLDFDAACITTIDPATLLSTGSFTDEPIEEIHDQLFQNEFLKKDVHQHEFLAKGLYSCCKSRPKRRISEQRALSAYFVT